MTSSHGNEDCPFSTPDRLSIGDQCRAISPNYSDCTKRLEQPFYSSIRRVRLNVEFGRDGGPVTRLIKNLHEGQEVIADPVQLREAMALGIVFSRSNQFVVTPRSPFVTQ